MDMMTAGAVIIRSKKPSVFPAVFLLKMLKWIIIRSKKKWRVAFSTDNTQEPEDIDRVYNAPGRSITVLVSEKK